MNKLLTCLLAISDAAITNAFATHTVRSMEFGGDPGTLAMTKAIAKSCHSMQTSL